MVIGGDGSVFKLITTASGVVITFDFSTTVGIFILSSSDASSKSVSILILEILFKLGLFNAKSS